MTAQEYKELKDSILSELMTKIGEILEEKLKPLTEALKNFTPNIEKEEGNEFPRDNFGIRKKTKILLERDSLGQVVKSKGIIKRDGFGIVKRNLSRIPEFHY